MFRLLELLKFTGQDAELESVAEEGRTLLAPTNDAFAKLDEETNQRLQEDKTFAQTVSFGWKASYERLHPKRSTSYPQR